MKTQQPKKNKDEHDDDRAYLRAQLTRQRRWNIPGQGYFPQCPICFKAIKNGGQIHESIITRGMLRSVNKAHFILVPQNSNLVHTWCHPESGRGSESDFRRCCMDLLMSEADGVMTWLETIAPSMPIVVAQARRDYLMMLDLELLELHPDRFEKTIAAFKEFATKTDDSSDDVQSPVQTQGE